MIKPTLDRIHEWNHSNNTDTLPNEIEDNAHQLVRYFTQIDIESMHFSYKDVLYSIAKATYIQVSNKNLTVCSFDTWAILLMLALDQVASEEGNKDVSKKSLSGIQTILHAHPERVDANIHVWLQDMFKNIYLF